MDLDVVFLGTSASAPTARRGTSALLIRRGGDRLLFDCGEGTQRQLLRSSIGLVDLEEIFVTHFHADHYLGLPGMLKTFALRMRETPLTDLRAAAGCATSSTPSSGSSGGSPTPSSSSSCGRATRSSATATRSASFRSSTVCRPLGYALVEEERPGRFDVAIADALGVPFGPERGALQRGEAVTLADGRTVTPGRARRAAAARPHDRLHRRHRLRPTRSRMLFAGADVLIHEATFSDDERDRAAETMHSTAAQAAEVARDAGRRRCSRSRTSHRATSARAPARGARDLPRDRPARATSTSIEVPFRERGEPALVKGGARAERPREPRRPAT